MPRAKKRLQLDNYMAKFVYTGQENVPVNVNHVQVHPSIKVIHARAFLRSLLMSVELHDGIGLIEKHAFYKCKFLCKILFPPFVRAIEDYAFFGCSGLTTAILNDGLEEIGERAFWGCALVCINIPSSIRAIKNYAFYDCSQLATAILNDGLEEIGERAFYKCRSLCEIKFPPSVRAIKDFAFYGCLGLATAILNDGLEEIGEWAFAHCMLLVRIVIPPSVRAIDNTAFNRCLNLTSVQFCDEIKEFVSGESMRHWWNNGVHEKCLSTYCFFVRCNIPKRVGLVHSATLQTSIHGMLERIPSIISPKSLNAYFDSIDSKLSTYEAKLSAYKGSTILELAIWKLEIAEQTDGNINLLTPDMKMGCRTESQWRVDFIVSGVLSFLHGGNGHELANEILHVPQQNHNNGEYS
jgi:hypothetical protein